jgi:hypothetical protein
MSRVRVPGYISLAVLQYAESVVRIPYIVPEYGGSKNQRATAVQSEPSPKQSMQTGAVGQWWGRIREYGTNQSEDMHVLNDIE